MLRNLVVERHITDDTVSLTLKETKPSSSRNSALQLALTCREADVR